MLQFFKQRKTKREREALYWEIVQYLRINYQEPSTTRFSLSDEPKISDKKDSKASISKYIAPTTPETEKEPQVKYSLSDMQFSLPAKDSAPTDSQIKYSLRETTDEPDSTPKVVVVNGEPVLVDGSSNMPSFTNEVKRLMNERGLTGTELCKRILMDRRLWSKLNTDVEYQPSRDTATAICIALHLNVEQAEELLKAAGYTLSATRKQDVVMRYFLQNSIYDIDAINEMLYRFGFKCIGTKV